MALAKLLLGRLDGRLRIGLVCPRLAPPMACALHAAHGQLELQELAPDGLGSLVDRGNGAPAPERPRTWMEQLSSRPQHFDALFQILRIRVGVLRGVHAGRRRSRWRRGRGRGRRGPNRRRRNSLPRPWGRASAANLAGGPVASAAAIAAHPTLPA
eukprot:444594-Lingulodinium_polyedra.AAC.2